ncbi:hypothetical protein FXF50_05095 [Micromonospora sp. AP08]|uniref:hypothetical protein n=1 Tax=Micromonospora sp. AP08 TaxID=2604467 RepID=UPI0011D6C65B|nr:hypothetical protein [Micromonospora sp. AP08]TYB39755.1 hypothetical protein FXF50_05095 [Micromonospora sp. AP08]
MTTPTGDQLVASIEALRADSGTWFEMADALRSAASNAAGLGLGPFHFTGLGHLLGLDAVYEDFQQAIVTLLEQGSANFEKVGGALRLAADAYEQDEIDNVHRLRNIY